MMRLSTFVFVVVLMVASVASAQVPLGSAISIKGTGGGGGGSSSPDVFVDTSGVLDQNAIIAALNTACENNEELDRECAKVIIPPGTYTFTDTLYLTGDGAAPEGTGSEGFWSFNLEAASTGYIQTPDTPGPNADRCAVTFQWGGAADVPVVWAHGVRNSILSGVCIEMRAASGAMASHGVLVTADSAAGQFESSRGLILDRVDIDGYQESFSAIASQNPTTAVALLPADYATTCADARGTPPCSTDAQVDRVVIRDSRLQASRCFVGANGFTNGVVVEDTECKPTHDGFWAEDSDLTLSRVTIDDYAGPSATGDEDTVCGFARAGITIGSTSANQPKQVHVESTYIEMDCGLALTTVAATDPLNTRNSVTTVIGGGMAAGGNSQTRAAVYSHWGTLNIHATVGARNGEVFEDDLIQIEPPDGGRLRVSLNIQGLDDWNSEATGAYTVTRNANVLPLEGLTSVRNRTLPPTGNNFMLNSPNSNWDNTTQSIAALMLSPGSTTQPSTMCTNTLPVAPHPDLVGWTPEPIDSNIGCTYSTNLGGYDQHVNNAASTMIGSMHGFIGAGDQISHIAMISSHSSFTTGDCINAAIIGSITSQMRCDVVGTGGSARNVIQGGGSHKMDFRGVTTPSDASDNTIVGGFGNVITGPSNKGLISGGYQNAIIINTSLGRVYGTKVSGHGSKVFSADIGDGTHMEPHFAEAHGHAAQSWLPGMKCEAYSWTGDTPNHLSANGEDGPLFNEAQRCKLGMTNSRISVGTTESLWLDWNEDTVPFVLGPGLWHVSGELTCATAEVTLSSGANPSATAVFDVDHSIYFESATGEAHVLANDGTTLNQSQSLTQTTEYTEGGQRNDVTASIVARDGTVGCTDLYDDDEGSPPTQTAGSPDGLCDADLATADLFGGFNFDVTNTAGSLGSGFIQCFADLEITMHIEN